MSKAILITLIATLFLTIDTISYAEKIDTSQITSTVNDNTSMAINTVMSGAVGSIQQPQQIVPPERIKQQQLQEFQKSNFPGNKAGDFSDSKSYEPQQTIRINSDHRQKLPLPIDRRMRTLVYSPNDVYNLKFKVGYNSQVIFPDDESPILQTFGDSRGWSVKLVGNSIYMKPMDPGLSTNMIITTNKDRTYYFDISSTFSEDFEDDDFFYRLSFYYPDIQPDAPVFAKRIGSINGELSEIKTVGKRKLGETAGMNFKYSYAGSGKSIQPTKVFDDGMRTYIMFKNSKIPSIYAVDKDGTEYLLKYKIEDKYVVLDTTEYQFALRFGGELVCIFNDKFATQK
jgi:type IV secretion system protein VirB9